MNKKNKLRLLILFVWLVSVITFFISVGADLLTWDDLKVLLISSASWSAIIFILIYIFRSFFFIPVTAMAPLAGFFYGPSQGLLVLLIAANLSGIAMFGFSRYLGLELLHNLDLKFINKFSKGLKNNGFLPIFVTRMIPFISFDLVSAASGLSKVSFKTYLLANFFGVIPLSIAYVLVGSAVKDFVYFYYAIPVLVLITIVTLRYRKKFS